MRRGCDDVKVITSPIAESETGKSGGQVIGVSLGWDFISEHEWGIDGIKSAFGIPGVSRKAVGADARAVTELPKQLILVDGIPGYSYLMFQNSYAWEGSDLTANNLNRMLRCFGKGDMDAAWDEKSFGVRLRNGELEEGKMALGQIYEAFTKLDAMIFLGGSRELFGGRGLVLAIRSRMPADILKAMADADEDYLNLQEAAEKTGIKQKLEAGGKQYFACSPSWISPDSDKKTEHPVMFWLNPCDQRANNYGWFTVEELLEWIDGKGPIPISRAD